MIRKLLLPLVAVITIIAMVVPGCTPTLYNLTMAWDPAAGGTATDVTGASPYAAVTEVDIQATAYAGYVFTGWTTDAGGIFDDAGAATTKFSMPSNDVTVTAHFVPVFDLTMVVSPSGAGTTNPAATTQQGAGIDVNIQATVTAPYQFSHWSAPAGTFDDETDPTTTFEMPAEDVTVTAHFVGPLDHFTVYDVDWDTAPPAVDQYVTLEDQFGVVEATVRNVVAFCNPAQKSHGPDTTPIWNPDHHLAIYTIDYEVDPQSWQVQVENQFGVQGLTVWGPIALAVPTQKTEPGDHEPPTGLDHYLIYYAIESPYIGESVEVKDQLGDPIDVMVHRAIYFANPVKKTHGDEVTEILNPEDHVVIYWIEEGPFNETVKVSNQFVDDQTLDIFGPTGLAVPSTKSSFFTPPLDHFKGYLADDVSMEPIMEPVGLEDQFGAFDAIVESTWFFCNPAVKLHDGAESMIWNEDHHLTVYSIHYEGDPGMWAVGVDNQFGTQHLTVFGPVALAVPTQKDGHPMPEGLDHYLIYEVIEGPLVNALVGLGDQWTFDPEVLVTIPRFFANPVKKIHGEDVFEILNPEAHLVFYEIWMAGPFSYPGLPVVNQFGAQFLNIHSPGLLATPSWKLYVDPMG